MTLRGLLCFSFVGSAQGNDKTSLSKISIPTFNENTASALQLSLSVTYRPTRRYDVNAFQLLSRCDVNGVPERIFLMFIGTWQCNVEERNVDYRFRYLAHVPRRLYNVRNPGDVLLHCIFQLIFVM